MERAQGVRVARVVAAWVVVAARVATWVAVVLLLLTSQM
eukprot:COSAG02_NODE_856_length_16468_cov_131.787831_20_plen_39_part_00